MANLTYRTGTPAVAVETTVKPSALSYEELDGNFKSLNDDIQTRKKTSDLVASGGASGVGFTPTGNVTSTTVQAAIAEVDTDLDTFVRSYRSANYGNLASDPATDPSIEVSTNKLSMSLDLHKTKVSGFAVWIGIILWSNKQTFSRILLYERINSIDQINTID